MLDKQGFLTHVKKEHNMWSYMYFMLYLSETDPNDFTALELHVYKLVTNRSSSRFVVIVHI